MRGFDPWPGCYSYFRGQRLQIRDAEAAVGSAAAGEADGPGFFVQNADTGPALFLAMDPLAGTAPGDVVDLTITHETGEAFSRTVLNRVRLTEGVRAASGSLRRTLNVPDGFFGRGWRRLRHSGRAQRQNTQGDHEAAHRPDNRSE